ncbi:MAG: helix-turn-helix domain-containing protein [Steroidobacteraceae bacterium]
MNVQTLSHPQRIAVSPGEYAFATGLSISTVQRKLASGEIRSAKVGRRRLIPREELERLLSGVARQSTEGAA